MEPDMRVEALDRAVRVSLSMGGDKNDEVTVDRAEAFYDFLTKI